jgi:hypothetical protein
MLDFLSGRSTVVFVLIAVLVSWTVKSEAVRELLRAVFRRGSQKTVLMTVEIGTGEERRTVAIEGADAAEIQKVLDQLYLKTTERGGQGDRREAPPSEKGGL